MPRKFFTRISREFRQKESNPWYMKPFEFILTHPAYFASSRRGIGGALWIGLFIGLLPIPAHGLLALLGSLAMRVNVPVAIAATFVTNPVTFVPIYYFGYKVGTALMGLPTEAMPDEISLDWVLEEIDQRWKPLIYGSAVMAISVASTVYLVFSAVWHVATVRRYRQRHQRNVGNIKGGKPQQK